MSSKLQQIPKITDVEKLILKEGSLQPDRMFTIKSITRTIAAKAGLPREMIADDAIRIALHRTSSLLTSGAVEYMTEIVYKTESTQTSEKWPFGNKYGYFNSQGKLSDAQFQRFKPKGNHVRYPTVFRITELGRALNARIQREEQSSKNNSSEVGYVR
ncbi:MAG: hypothetical protein PXY39_02945 [archaeon]|nr:hypothetical protein [archaeon]